MAPLIIILYTLFYSVKGNGVKAMINSSSSVVPRRVRNPRTRSKPDQAYMAGLCVGRNFFGISFHHSFSLLGWKRLLPLLCGRAALLGS